MATSLFSPITHVLVPRGQQALEVNVRLGSQQSELKEIDDMVILSGTFHCVHIDVAIEFINCPAGIENQGHVGVKVDGLVFWRLGSRSPVAEPGRQHCLRIT